MLGMTRGQKAALKLSEERSALLAALDGGDEEKVASCTDAVRAAEVSYRAALTADAAGETLAAGETRTVEATEARDSVSGETTELARMGREVSISRYVGAAASGRAVDGVEAEYGAAIGIPEGRVPWIALLEADERAVTVAPTSTRETLRRTLERVFAPSLLPFLGFSIEAVPSGRANYAHISAGNTWAYRAKGAAVTYPAGTISSVSVSPTRMSVGYEFAAEDAAIYQGMEELLRRDMRATYADRVSRAVLNNTASSDGFNGLLAGLAAPSAVASTEDTYATYLASLAGHVDGLYAADMSDLRLLLGKTGYAHFASTQAASGYADGATLASKLGGVRTSGHMPTPAAGAAAAILRIGADPGAIAVPMWDSLALIRDPYTDAAKAQVSLTAHALWSMSILRQAHLRRVLYKVT